MTIEIVDFPIQSAVDFPIQSAGSFHSSVNVYQMVNPIKSH
jgi:hypothetical protein